MSAIEDISAAARAGGVPLNGTAAAAKGGEYLSFHLGSEEYGIDILRVQEIRGYENPTRIANTPEYLKGVVNLRGVIVPIVDLRVKFSLPGVSYDASTVVIILNIASQTLGIVVDAVSDVLDLKDGQIKPAPAFANTDAMNYITGIGNIQLEDRERMLILIDIERLIQSDELGLLTGGAPAI